MLRYGDFSVFQDGSCPPSWICKIAMLNVLWHQDANARHLVKFRQNRSKDCGDIAILRFSKMAAAAILDFQKFKFLLHGNFEKPNMRHCSKFRQDR